MNGAQRQLVLQKLQEKLFVLKGRTIGLHLADPGNATPAPHETALLLLR